MTKETTTTEITTEMGTEARVEFADFERIAPGVRAALTALSKAVADSGLEKALTELVKVRASQVNGCAYCLQYHLTLARKSGVEGTKLDLLAVWRDAGIFTARERAALAWTETLTKVTPEGVGDEAWQRAREAFGESELVFLTAAIANINAWNRIAMAFLFAPPIPQKS